MQGEAWPGGRSGAALLDLLQETPMKPRCHLLFKNILKNLLGNI